MVRWRNRAHGRLGVTVKNDAGDILAIDGRRNGAAEFSSAKPGFPGVRDRSVWTLIEPQKIGIQTGTGVPWRAGAVFLKALVGLGIEAVDELQFSAFETQQFDVAVSLNIEMDAVEIGQRAALRVVFPVIRIPREFHVRAGLVVGNVEGTQN